MPSLLQRPPHGPVGDPDPGCPGGPKTVAKAASYYRLAGSRSGDLNPRLQQRPKRPRGPGGWIACREADTSNLSTKPGGPQASSWG